MAQNYNGGGAYLRNVPVGMQTDGTGPDTAVADAFFTAVEPAAGTWGTVVIAAQPDAPRNVTFGIIDANTSLTGAVLEVIGTDAQGRALEETLTATSGGTQTVVGARCFATITSARYIVSGVVTSPGDTVQGGYGDVLGIPYAIADVSDVRNRRQDANAGVGTISIPTGTHGTWTLSGPNTPNGTRLYYADIWSSAE